MQSLGRLARCTNPAGRRQLTEELIVNSFSDLELHGISPERRRLPLVPAGPHGAPPAPVNVLPAWPTDTPVTRCSSHEMRERYSARNSPSPDPARSIWAVRVDRPDGTHHFVGPEPGKPAAEARRRREQLQWSAAGLWAPSASVVTMAAADFAEHARRHPDCTSVDCAHSTERPPAETERRQTRISANGCPIPGMTT